MYAQVFPQKNPFQSHSCIFRLDVLKYVQVFDWRIPYGTESAEKENEFNEAYKEEYKAFEALAAGIVKVTAGKIDRKTAGNMFRR